MKSVLGIIVLASGLAFGLAACAVDTSSRADPALSSVAEVAVSEADSLTTLDETASPQACARVWDCRRCPNGQNQNILVDVCTEQVVRARACGEPCF